MFLFMLFNVVDVFVRCFVVGVVGVQGDGVVGVVLWLLTRRCLCFLFDLVAVVVGIAVE